jgi:predicted O-linked N-acetylglucosamine transferase (SPINDLY family)
LQHARQALALLPDFALASHTLGLALQAQGDVAAAATAFRQATAQQPGFVGAHVDLGAALFAQSDLEGAAASLARALALDPGNTKAMNNLGGVRLDQGRPEEAAALYRQALARDPNYLEALSNLTFTANFIVGCDTAEQQRLRRDWNAAVKRRVPAPAPAVPKSRGERLRIGYVSAHFRHQAAAYALAPGIVHHDRAQFEVVCYSDTRSEDEVTAALRAAATTWRDTRGVSDDALAAQIRDDGIDILVDCTGHMGGARLLTFARKPAPIQVTAWGEPTGTGLADMDYLLADPVLVPAAERALFSEAIADLPCFLGYWTPDALPEAGSLRAAAVGHVTFGSFNRAAKITEATLALWARVLDAVPSARLLLKDKAWSHPANRAHLHARFAAHGLAPERVDLVGGTTRADHFVAYQQIDIALDPMPHGGGMTTLEALWMGVPVITTPGATPSSRLASAVLTALDLGEWCAADEAGYVAKAVVVAADLSSLASLRQGLRARIAASRLAPVAYARALEDVFLKIAR